MKRSLGMFLLVACWTGPVLAGTLELDGKLIQGGLVLGKADPGTTVTFQGKQVRVTSEGVFLIGFTRDAKPMATLVLRYPDGSRRTEKLKIARRTYNIQRIDGLPRKMVTPSKKDLKRIKRERAEIGRARARDIAEPHFLKGWIWPARGRISGVYGSQRILNGKPRQPHYGVDVAAPVGTPVIAPSDGVVTLAARGMYFTGNTIIIDHGHGLSSAFLHMDSLGVKVGQPVKQGERIGTIGATGRVTGPHLDWRINLLGARIDPQLLVPPAPQPLPAKARPQSSKAKKPVKR